MPYIAMLALWLTLAGLILVAGIYVLQERMLYFPEQASVADVVAQRLSAWPAASEFRGWVTEPAGPARASAIVFHGNAGHAGQREHYAAVLTRLGLRVILAEYPGYGPRAGRLGERSLVADAERTILRAYQLYGAPLVLVGESLGAGVAAAAAARHSEQLAGLILLTPWDRLASVAAYHYPWLPVAWLLRDRYDSCANLAAFEHPVLVVVAEHDSTVPARFGRALYASLAAPKRLAVIAGAEHNDWNARVDQHWWREATRFALGAAAEPGLR